MNSKVAVHASRITVLRIALSVTIAAALHQARQRLLNTSDTASLDAQVLLAHILGRPRAWVLAHPEAPLSEPETQSFQNALARLECGEPLPYILGQWEFYGLDFQVTPDVLIPRPETELLVDQALAWLNTHPGPRLAADIGTGSGCIAVSLAVHLPDLNVIATELSYPALQIARLNAQRHHVSDQIDFVQADLLTPFPYSRATHSVATPLPGELQSRHSPALPLPSEVLFRRSPAPLLPRSPAPPFDLLCANLPYIPTGTLKSLDVARSEPWLALHGGADGLDRIRELLFSAPGRMAPGGALFLEIESGQGEAAHSLARQAFPGLQVHIHQDLAGNDRLVVVQRNNSTVVI